MDNREYVKTVPAKYKQIVGNTAYVLLWTYTSLLVFVSFFSRYFVTPRKDSYWFPKPGFKPRQTHHSYIIDETTHEKRINYYDGIYEFWPITDDNFFSAWSIEEFLFFVSVPWIVTYHLKKGQRSAA